MFMETATGPGEGVPATLIVDHKCTAIDLDAGVITFENGKTVRHDVVVGADGIGVCLTTSNG